MLTLSRGRGRREVTDLPAAVREHRGAVLSPAVCPSFREPLPGVALCHPRTAQLVLLLQPLELFLCPYSLPCS